MCKDCGCESALHQHHHSDHDHTHDHTHDNEPGHDHSHEHDHSQKIELGQKVLAENDEYAGQNRQWLAKNHMTAINLISSPGSGKTLLLEKTIELLKGELALTILVGDQSTDKDAQRLLRHGAPVKQINTISSCHLDAHMIGHELESFVSPSTDLLVIENVGNLVCPAAFDLGEKLKIALLSTPEGEDKPEKYPVLFHEAELVVITKTDLIPHLDWSKEKCLNSIHKVNPKAKIIFLSSKTGEGLSEWTSYLKELCQHKHDA